MSQLGGERSVGAKRHLETSIAHLKVLRQRLNGLTHRGGSIASREEKRSDRIKWDDLTSEFSSRIRTATIINLRHVDALTFLEDSMQLFKIGSDQDQRALQPGV